MRKQLLCLLLCLVMLAAICVSAAAAGEANDEYTYTVRVFSGKQGTLGSNGATMIPFTGLKEGERFDDIDLSDVNMPADSKYYAQSFRISGKDKNDATATNFQVTEDMDIVVNYALRGTMIPVTIHFVDAATGNQLAADRSYEFKVGDRPIVPSRDIDGYTVRGGYNIRFYLDPEVYPATRQSLEYSFQYDEIIVPTPTPIPTAAPQQGGTTPGGTVIYVTPTPAPQGGTTTQTTPAPTQAPANPTVITPAPGGQTTFITPAPANNPTIITPAPANVTPAPAVTNAPVNPTLITPGPGGNAPAGSSPAAANTATPITPAPTPEIEEILDIDGPLGEFQGGASGEESPQPTETPAPTDTPEPENTPVPVSGPGRFSRSTAIIGGVAAAVIAIGGGAWIALIRRKRNEDEEN